MPTGVFPPALISMISGGGGGGGGGGRARARARGRGPGSASGHHGGSGRAAGRGKDLPPLPCHDLARYPVRYRAHAHDHSAGQVSRDHAVRAGLGGRTRATRRDFQSLLGLLKFVAGVAPPARLFTNRILDCLREAPRMGSVTLSLQFKQDVRFFADLLPIFVGRKVMGKCILPYQHQVELDACLTGCGAVAGDQFYANPFPQSVLDGGHSIAHLEMLNVVVAVKMWRERWPGWTVQIYCDNANTVALLQTGKSRDDFMRACAREIFLYAAAFDIDVQACHRPGVQMVWADALSREHTHDKFRRFVREDQHLSSARRLEVPPGLFGLVNTL